MSKSVIPKMVEGIIEELEELSRGNYGIEDTISLYTALEEINTILDELCIREKEPYEEPVQPKTVQRRKPNLKKCGTLWRKL